MQECVQQAWFRYPSNHRRYPLPHAIFQRWSIPYQKYTRYPCGECHTVLLLSFILLYIYIYKIFPSSIHLGIVFYTTLHYTVLTFWCVCQNGLLRLHGRSVWGLRRRRLTDHARLLHCMDMALSTQPLADLSHDTLRTVSVVLMLYFWSVIPYPS